MIQKLGHPRSLKSRLLHLIFPLLPRDTQDELVRKSLQFPRSLDARLRIKLADTQEEFTAAFELTNKVGIETRTINPDPSGLRLTPHHAVPFTKTIIATWDGQVVATVSVTPDSAFGLPMSNNFDLSQLRRSDRRIVEVFALAVDARFRADYREVVFPLFKYVFQFVEKFMMADYLVATMPPSTLQLYQAVLLFTPLADYNSKGYNFINGLPSAAAYVNVKTHKLALAAQYKGTPSDRSPLIFLTYSFANLQFPEQGAFQLTEPAMTPAMLDYFFNRRTDIFSRLTPEKRGLIAGMYDQNAYGAVIPSSEVAKRAERISREPRFYVELQSRVITLDGQMHSALVLDASMSGFKIEINTKLPFGEPIHMTVAVGDAEIVDVRAIPVRQGPNNTYGFQIAQSQQGWRDFIEALEQERQNQLMGAEPSNLGTIKLN